MRTTRALVSRATALACGMLLAASSGGAVAPLSGTARDDDWVEVRSPNFRIFSNLGPGDASGVARRLEYLREVLETTNPTLQATTPEPTHIYAFRGASSFKPYLLRGVENLSGYFTAAADRNFIAFDASQGDDVFYHEFIHGYLRHNFVNLPLWVNEGLATYFSTFEVGAKWAEIGEPVPGYVAWMSEHQPIPLEQMFEMTTESPDYRQGDTRHTFYAQSWALTHYLLRHSPDEARKFERFLARIQLGNPPLRAFEEVAPRARWDELMKEVEKYCNGTSFKFLRYEFKQRLLAIEPQTASMRPADAMYRLGELAAQLDLDGAFAEEHFRAAFGADTLHAAAMASLGALMDRRGVTATAESLYSAAAEIAPDDPFLYALAGRGAMRRYTGPTAYSVDVSRQAPSALRIARQRFLRCLELDPDRLEALIGFGQSYCTDGDPPRAAVSALRAASALLPARIDVAWHLTLLLARAHRCIEAESVLIVKIEPLAEPRMTKVLDRAVFHCRIDEASTAAKVGAADEAEQILERVLSRARDPEMKAIAEAQLENIRRREQRGFTPQQESNQSTAAFNSFGRAVRAANGGHYDEALRILRQERDSTWHEDLLDHSRRMETTMLARKHVSEAIALVNSGDLARAKSVLAGIRTVDLDDSTLAQVERMRRRTDARIAIQRGVQRVQRGNLESAESLVDSVLASRVDDDLRGYAQALGNEVGARMATQRGIDLMKAGKLHEARSHFEGLLDAPMTNAMRATVRGLIVHTSGRIEAERAIELANHGATKQARTILAEVLETPIGSGLRRYVESLMNEIAKADAKRR